jgi:hypothetical protein
VRTEPLGFGGHPVHSVLGSTMRCLRRSRLGTCSWSFPDWKGTFYRTGTKDQLAHCARQFEALELEVPASRYQPSLHPYPEQLEPIHYPPGMPVRKAQGIRP